MLDRILRLLASHHVLDCSWMARGGSALWLLCPSTLWIIKMVFLRVLWLPWFKTSRSSRRIGNFFFFLLHNNFVGVCSSCSICTPKSLANSNEHFLQWILPDWSDEQCFKLLKNCYKWREGNCYGSSSSSHKGDKPCCENDLSTWCADDGSKPRRQENEQNMNSWPWPPELDSVV